VILAPALFLWLAICPTLDSNAAEARHDYPGRVASAAARDLNRAGKELYRERRFEEARAKYRAAMDADPVFVDPVLNVACSYARQERFGEAAREASALVERAFVPWGREVLEATDLATLHVRAEWERVRSALAASASAWGRSARDGLLFVGRTQPAVDLRRMGVLVIQPYQEIFAWLPETGAYRQITAENGRVLAFVRSLDGRTIAYITGGKLVRKPGVPPRLRRLAVRTLDLGTMTLSDPVTLKHDLTRLELRFQGAWVTLSAVEPDGEKIEYRFDGQDLKPLPAVLRAGPGVSVVLTGQGVATAAHVAGPRRCRFSAFDQHPPDKPPQVLVRSSAGTMHLQAPYGAGLFGLPF
jgi:hypothetical protein